MRARVGAALPVALLLLLALTLLANGLLVLARGEAATSRASAEHLQAEVAALAAARQVEWPDLPSRVGEPGAEPVELVSGREGAVSWTATAARTGRELILVQGHGGVERPDGRGPRASVASVLWALDPLGRVEATGATVEASGISVSVGGRVEGAAAAREGAAACPDLLAALDSVVPAAGWEGWRTGVPDPTETELPRLGALGGDSVLARLEAESRTRVLGTPGTEVFVTPHPDVEGDRCLTGTVTNWGDPLDPGAPCGDHRPVMLHRGDLAVEGGRGQGLLAVTGDVTLGGGFTFHGLLLAGGDVEVEEGATFLGPLRSSGIVRVGSTGRVVGAACPLVGALEAAPALGRPVVVPGAGRLSLPRGGG